MASPVILRVKVDLNDQEAVAEAVALTRRLRQTLGEVQLKINAAPAKREIRATRKELGLLKRAAQAAAVAFTGYASAVFLAGTALRALTREVQDSVVVFANFDRVLNTIQVVANATSEEIANIRKEAEVLGASTEFTASQVAELQLVLARGGFNPDEIVALSRAVLDLATVTGEEPVKAAGALTSVIRTFNLEATNATEVLDILTKGFNSSRLQLEFFTTAFGFVGPVAEQAGLSLRDLTALFGFLADRGLRASTAGTSLRQILIDLRNPASQAAQAVGFTVNNAEGLFLALQKLNEEGIASSDVFRKTAVPAVDLLRKTLDDGTLSIRDFRGELDDVEGAASDAAKVIRDDLRGDLDNLASSFESLKLAFGATQEGGLRDLIQGFTEDLRGLAATLRGNQVQEEINRLEARFTQLGSRSQFEAFLGATPLIGAGARSLFGRTGGELANQAQEQQDLARRLTLLRRLRDEGVESVRAFEEFAANREFNLFNLGAEDREGVPFVGGVPNVLDLVNQAATGLTEEGERILDLFLKRYRTTKEEIEADPINPFEPDGGGGRGGRGGAGAGTPAAAAPRLDIREFERTPASTDTLVELNTELNRLAQERVRLIEEGADENERALEINDAAQALTRSIIGFEKTRLQISESETDLNELRAEQITKQLFLTRNQAKLSEEQKADLEDEIIVLGNRIAVGEEQAKLDEAKLEAERQKVALARQNLEASKEITDEEEKQEETTRRRLRLLVNAFDELAASPFSSTVNAVARLNDLFIRLGEEGVETGDKIRLGIGIANGAIQDGLQFAIEASERRERQVEEEFNARIDAAQGFAQVQRELEEERDEALRRERERQARLQKAQAIFNITLSGFQAVAAALTNPLTAPFVIPFITSLVAAQIAAVAATPVPEFQAGGVLGGNSHAEGGNRGVFQGQPFEAERGEFMDFDEFGNLVFVNKRSTAAFSKQLRAMQGKTFAGKQGVLSAINAKYGQAFSSLPAFFQEGGIISERSGGSLGLGLSAEQLLEIIYSGTFTGTSDGIQTVDTNRRRERQRQSRANGDRGTTRSRRIFGLDGTANFPARPGVPEIIE